LFIEKIFLLPGMDPPEYKERNRYSARDDMARHIIAIIATFLILISFGQSRAEASGKSCYRADEAQAEQGVRIESELMVIGLNCAGMRNGGQNLYVEYRKWAAKHGSVFAEYESKLLDYYKRTGTKNPEASLHTLRTVLANKVATDAAHMRPDLFCAKYAPRISKVSTMDDATIRRWSATFFPGHPVSKPVCEQ
jgi:hypothetical protein